MSDHNQRIQTRKINCAQNFAEASMVHRQNPCLYKHTNCLSYALGLPELGFALPGCFAKNGTFYENQNHSSLLRELFAQDGLIEIDETLLTVPDTQIIALTIKEYLSGHVYKYHQDGTWSQQKGYGGEITNLDSDGQIITDLRKANLGYCDEFVGYFKVPNDGLKFIPRIEVK